MMKLPQLDLTMLERNPIIWSHIEKEKEIYTKVGVMSGVGAAKTGVFWMREGIEEEEEEEEGGGVASLAEMVEGRNVGVVKEVLEAEKEERQQPLMEEVDIVPSTPSDDDMQLRVIICNIKVLLMEPYI